MNGISGHIDSPPNAAFVTPCRSLFYSCLLCDYEATTECDKVIEDRQSRNKKLGLKGISGEKALASVRKSDSCRTGWRSLLHFLR
jgi:hypothetical protein